MENIVKVDAMGKACPIPVVMTLKAIKGMESAGTVVTLVDNGTAVQNLQKLAADRGLSATVETKGDNSYEVSIAVPEGLTVSSDEIDNATCLVPQKKNVVVQISSDAMGSGDDKLGRQLMKAFIYSLTQQDELPQTVIFYNGGAHLTCEGSLSLEDIQAMADAGVDIMTCGTCLNYYGITDQLKVGRVSNMYEIVDKLEGATLVVRP
ncbi:MAG: sulfurtransferase-like selenium metabolism protein YedF [Tractidigestivibacter sp.]|jgi:selenium metabolism protein YedF|uniref:sulfurtransferase-like selenium metabolism protein YedF n=1 Tax=Tractidigestivibacter sp. TaxID=2847320 RepID=UPI003D8F960B